MVLQVCGCIFSLVSLATALVSFQKALRLSQADTKAKLSIPGMAVQFLWRVCTIASRVLAFALFASYFHVWVIVAAAAHWLLSLIFVCVQQTNYCMLEDDEGHQNHSRVLEYLFRFLTAFVHVFCFFNLIEGHTRLRCLVYYCVVFLEDLAMVIALYFTASAANQTSWYILPGVILVPLLFLLGIGFQVFYYLKCHPNNTSPDHENIHTWVKCSELSLIKDTRDTKHPEEGKFKNPLHK